MEKENFPLLFMVSFKKKSTYFCLVEFKELLHRCLTYKKPKILFSVAL